jgi:serine/threonine protein kinase
MKDNWASFSNTSKKPGCTTTMPFGVANALAVATDIADAMAAAHHEGFVHRDLKPGNVMLGKAGTARQGSPHAKLSSRHSDRSRRSKTPRARPDDSRCSSAAAHRSAKPWRSSSAPRT